MKPMSSRNVSAATLSGAQLDRKVYLFHTGDDPAVMTSVNAIHPPHYYSLHRETFMQHYHKRSNVESTFSMVKAKFGGFVRSKLPVAQIDEVLRKILAHNICCLIQSMYELGVEVTF